MMGNVDNDARFSLVDPPVGIGIVVHEFRPGSGFEFTTANQDTVLRLRRISLIQLAFLDPDVRVSGALDGYPIVEIPEIVLGEAMPLLQRELQPTSYELNARATTGAVLRYRGIDFLFTTFAVDAQWDFACWRLPRASGAHWPAVTEAGDPA